MKIITKLSRSKVAAEAGHNLHLLVRLRAPAASATAERAPVCIVPVVDVSGSMGGEKLAAVQKALECLIAHLVPGDHIGLVTFDSDVRTLMPVVEVTQQRKVEFARLVRGLQAGSSTNLGGGVLEGARIVKAANLPAKLKPRLIVLTDGLANAGPATTPGALRALVQECARGLGLSAFGYGGDCDQALLGDLANVGAGSYAYIQNQDAVMTAFARELGGLQATYASGVRVRVVPQAGAPVEGSLGDLLYSGESVFSAPLAVAAHARADGIEVASVSVTFNEGSGAKHEAIVAVRADFVKSAEADATDDPEVVEVRDEHLVRIAQEQADALARQGEFEAARLVLLNAADAVANPKLGKFAREVLALCYAGQDAYVGTGGLRASAASALKRNRQVMPEAKVAAAFDLGISAAEADMERSFRKGAKSSSKRASSKSRRDMKD